MPNGYNTFYKLNHKTDRLKKTVWVWQAAKIDWQVAKSNEPNEHSHNVNKLMFLNSMSALQSD